MIRAYVYKLKPNNKDKQRLEQVFWNSRFIYNWALNLKINTYKDTKKNLSAFDIMKECTKLRKEKDWLKIWPVDSLNKSILNMGVAFKNFFKWWWFPKYKNKGDKQTMYVKDCISIDYETSYMKIPKLWKIRFYKDRKISGKIKNATITKKSTWYYISLCCDINTERLWAEAQWNVGIDVGLKHFMINSEWDKINNPRFFIESQKLLALKQRHLARQKKGSNRHNKTKIEISKLYEHILNQRKDFLHKLSTLIAKKYDTVYVENLNVKGMAKNKSLSKHIHDASRSTFNEFLSYKCNNLIKIGRFEPSSKMCNICGNINQELKLSDRKWSCKECWTKHDRDINAAINIMKIWVETQLTNANQRQ